MSPSWSWGVAADPARVSILAAAAGVEQAGLLPPREPSYHLQHYLPEALFRCLGQIPGEACLSWGQVIMLAAGLGASSCLSGSNVSMDCSSLWQISWKNTAEKWFPKSDFIAFCLPRRQTPQLSQYIRLYTEVLLPGLSLQTKCLLADRSPWAQDFIWRHKTPQILLSTMVSDSQDHTQKTQLASRVVWCISNTKTQSRRDAAVLLLPTHGLHTAWLRSVMQRLTLWASPKPHSALQIWKASTEKGSSHPLKSAYLTRSYKTTITPSRDVNT